MKLFLIFVLFISVRLGSANPNDSKELNNAEDSDIELIKKDCNCRLGSENKIVGGQYADPNSIPWMVSLVNSDNNYHFCGGTIINHNYILTASHCLDQFKDNPEKIKVLVGLHDQRLNVEETYVVNKFALYNFNATTMEPGDIAILKLDKPITFKRGKIEPACLNFEKKTYENEIVMISGWGSEFQIMHPLTDSNTDYQIPISLSPLLKKVDFQVKGENCPDHYICINQMQTEPMLDSLCHGDSGGPLHHTVNGITFVEGLVSRGDYQIEHNIFGYYAIWCTGKDFISRLSYYEKEVKEVIKENYCPLKR